MSLHSSNGISDSNLNSIGAAFPLSMSMVDMAMASSISILMMNAVSTQKNTQIIENATVSQCCSLIISAGFAGAAP
jgi:hypothetical protein